MTRTTKAEISLALAFVLFIALPGAPAAFAMCMAFASVWAASVIEYLEAKTIKPSKSVIEIQQLAEQTAADLAEMKNKISSLSIAAAAKPFVRR